MVDGMPQTQQKWIIAAYQRLVDCFIFPSVDCCVLSLLMNCEDRQANFLYKLRKWLKQPQPIGSIGHEFEQYLLLKDRKPQHKDDPMEVLSHHSSESCLIYPQT